MVKTAISLSSSSINTKLWWKLLIASTSKSAYKRFRVSFSSRGLSAKIYGSFSAKAIHKTSACLFGGYENATKQFISYPWEWLTKFGWTSTLIDLRIRKVVCVYWFWELKVFLTSKQLTKDPSNSWSFWEKCLKKSSIVNP